MRGFTVVHQKNLRQKWPRFANFVFWWDVKKPYTDYVYTTVRGFTVVYQKTYVRNGRGLKSCGLMRCLDKELYYWLWVYHGERIHSGIFIKQIQIRILLTVPYTDTDMYIPLWEDSQWYTIKPTSDLAEDCQVWCGGDEKYKENHVTCYMYMLHVTCYLLNVLYIANIYIPLWEDSQWYAIKTYVRSGRGLPGFDTGEMEIGGTCY